MDVPLRQAKKQATRRAILEAANELLRREGFAGTTMREIARVANVSYQTLYNYFPTKALVVRALLTDDLHTVSAGLERLINDSTRPLLDLLDAVVRHDFAMINDRDRRLYREVTVELIRQSEDFQAVYALIDTTAHAMLGDVLGRAQAKGELDPGLDVEVLAHVLFVIIDFAFLGYIAAPTRTRADVLASIREQITLVLTPYLIR